MAKEYTNNETTVVWQPEKCIHSGICLMSLHKVFNLKQKPWVNMERAHTETIENTVAKCPSGALSIKGKENLREEFLEENLSKTESEVTVVKGGPVIINGEVVLKNPNGSVWKKGTDVAFCRCGQSQNIPFCDGTHVKLMKH